MIRIMLALFLFVSLYTNEVLALNDSVEPDVIWIKVRPGSNQESLKSDLRNEGSVDIKSFERPDPSVQSEIERWKLIKFPKNTDIEKKILKLKKYPSIESIEYSYIRKGDAISPWSACQSSCLPQNIPTDPFNRANVPNYPQYDVTWNYVAINMPEAWAIQTGSSNVVIAVLDSGAQLNNPVPPATNDLYSSLWRNSGEIPNNGVDDDHNGYIDDYNGYDFAYGDSQPIDHLSHGTHVAGILGATANNGQGIAGVSRGSTLMILQVLQDNNLTTTTSLVDAIHYLTMMKSRGVNIKIVNASLGGGGYSQVEYDAIRDANNVGILFAFSAGNNGANNDVTPYYPASYNLSNILSVGAIDARGNRTWWSNYGTSVHIRAPGDNIYSTYLNSNALIAYSGTSMATPHVVGAVALLASRYP